MTKHTFTSVHITDPQFYIERQAYVYGGEHDIYWPKLSSERFLDEFSYKGQVQTKHSKRNTSCVRNMDRKMMTNDTTCKYM